MTDLSDDQGLVTVGAAADFLDCSTSTVRRAMKRGDLTAVHLTPSLVRVTLDSLTGWVARGIEAPAIR